MNFRNDIQGIRAVAVLLVFIFHLDHRLLPGGFIGVDVFFVISGYLISSIIIHKKVKKSFNFIDFYIGRLKRIVPVFLVFLLVTLIIGLIVFFQNDILFLRKNLFWASVFNSNNYLSTLDNYFGATSSENPLLHTWTLAIEMQFYLLLPLLIVFVNKKNLFLLTFISTVFLFSLSYYNLIYLDLKGNTYFSLISRIPEFLIGTIFTLKEDYLRRKLDSFKNIFVLISVSLILFSSFFFNEKSNFPGLLVIIPCISTGFILIFYDSILNRFLSSKILVEIGQLSYSIYLWHWPIMAFIRYAKNEYTLSIFQMIIITLMTLIFSFLSYKYIENPFRKWSDKKSISWIVILYTLLGSLLYFMPKISNNISDIPPKFIQPTFGINSHGGTFKKIEVFGNINKPNDSILLIGDSHAFVYKAFLDTIGKKYNFNFYTVTNDRYPTIPGLDRKFFSEKRYYDQYAKLANHVNSKIIESKYILISSAWTDDIPSFVPVLENLMNKVGKDRKVIILSDFPVLKKNPIRLNRSILRDKNLNYNYGVKINEPPQDVLRMINKFDNLYYLHINYKPLVKDLPFINDTIAYYDSGHLNLYGSQTLGNILGKDFYSSFERIGKEKVR